MTIKDYKLFFKGISWCCSVNAFWKAKKMKYSLWYLERKYDYLTRNLPESKGDFLQEFQNLLNSKGIHLNRHKRPSVFWIGANYAQDSSGFLQALQLLSEVHCFKNLNGEYGLEYPQKGISEVVIERNSQQLINQIDEIEKSGTAVDLILGQLWANFISVDSLKKLQKRGKVIINISMDDRLPELWSKYRGKYLGAVGLVHGVDLTLTTSPECCRRFNYHGGMALYWPLASDPTLFKPVAHKDIDVSFVGNKYGVRGKIIQMIIDAGVSVSTFGSGWPNGAVNAKEASDIFNRSKIILGIGTIGHCDDVYTMKLRDFDATMAGALYITHRNPDLTLIFTEGVEIECYTDISEAVEKIKYYLARPDALEKIGHAAGKKARELYSWDKRLRDLFELIGFM